MFTKASQMPRPARLPNGLLSRSILACALSLAALLVGALHPQAALAEEAPAISRDLRADARLAAQKRQPILLFFSLADCPFCARVRREYLGPMSREPEQAARALYREIPIEATLTGFDGTPLAARDLAATLGVKFFPTVVMVDGKGQPLAAPLVGFSVPDFYGAYLEDRIATAVQKTNPR